MNYFSTKAGVEVECTRKQPNSCQEIMNGAAGREGAEQRGRSAGKHDGCVS